MSLAAALANQMPVQSNKRLLSVFCNMFCVLQPVGRFCGDGVGSVETSVPPGPLAQLHCPELDPGCGSAYCHGNRMITGV